MYEGQTTSNGSKDIVKYYKEEPKKETKSLEEVAQKLESYGLSLRNDEE